MRHIRPIAAMLLAVGLVLSTASSVLAQGPDPEVILDEALPADAAAGTSVTIGWVIEVTQDDGTALPYNAQGIFVRVTPTSGEPVDVAAGQDRPGHYRANVTVPAGGLGSVGFGVRGRACYADGHCEQSDSFFKVVDRPAAVNVPPTAAPVPTAAPATPEPPPATSFDLAWLPIALLAGLAIVAVVLAIRERRPSAT